MTFNPLARKPSNRKKRVGNVALRLAILSGLLFGAFSLAMLAGAYNVRAVHIYECLAKHLSGAPAPSLSRIQEVVIWDIRLPRMVLAGVSGVALAVSGTVYQGCFRNPLVEPYILGVSSGAACGAALAILFPHFFPLLTVAAFCCAMLAVAITWTCATSRGLTQPTALVLTGIIVGALFAAAVGIMKYLSSDAQLRELTFWMMGGFHYASWSDARLAATVILPGSCILWTLSWKLNTLVLGDEEARSLGINPALLRLCLVTLATLCVSICVASAGIIGWVGLMAPHAARMLLGPDNRVVIPGAAIIGAAYMLLCDTLARTIVSTEIPISIITALLGAPYLLWLIRTKGRELYGD